MVEKRLKGDKVRILIEDNIDEQFKREINKDLDRFLDLFEKKTGLNKLEELKFEVKKMNKEGKRTEHEVKLMLATDFGIFHSKKVGWNLQKAAKKSINAIKKQIDFM